MKFGELIKKYRTEHGLSQRQFALKCGLSNRYISMLESGINPNTGAQIVPKLQQLHKISQEIGMSISEISDIVDDLPIDLSVDPYQNSFNFISQHELKIIDAYRTNPEMQQAVDTLLNIKRDPNLHIVKKAARNGKYEVFTLTDDEFQKMKAADEALEDAPDDM